MDAYPSTLTWDEVVWIVKRLLNNEAAEEEGRKLLIFTNLKFISVDESIIMESQNLLEKYKIDPMDAIHAACAIRNGIK